MWNTSNSSLMSSTSTSIITNSDDNTKSLPKTMEEVWKEIGGLNHSNSNNYNNNSTLRLQDFFSRDYTASSSSGHVQSSPPAPSAPPTILTLSSLNDHNHFMMSSLLHHHHHNPIGNLNHHVSSSLINLDPGTKRFQPESGGGGDRRHKRMIKNRESAARSRARKQAYTNELELEVANLLEENAKLKKQQQQLYLAAAAQHQRNKSLHRTSTAPF